MSLRIALEHKIVLSEHIRAWPSSMNSIFYRYGLRIEDMREEPPYTIINRERLKEVKSKLQMERPDYVLAGNVTVEQAINTITLMIEYSKLTSPEVRVIWS